MGRPKKGPPKGRKQSYDSNDFSSSDFDSEFDSEDSFDSSSSGSYDSDHRYDGPPMDQRSRPREVKLHRRQLLAREKEEEKRWEDEDAEDEDVDLTWLYWALGAILIGIVGIVLYGGGGGGRGEKDSQNGPDSQDRGGSDEVESCPPRYVQLAAIRMPPMPPERSYWLPMKCISFVGIDAPVTFAEAHQICEAKRTKENRSAPVWMVRIESRTRYKQVTKELERVLAGKSAWIGLRFDRCGGGEPCLVNSADGELARYVEPSLEEILEEANSEAEGTQTGMGVLLDPKMRYQMHLSAGRADVVICETIPDVRRLHPEEEDNR